MTEQLYLVAYDVADPKRLRKIHERVKRHAFGGQRSVFECWLSEKERRALLESVERILNPAEDRFFILLLDQSAPIKALGVAVPPAEIGFRYHG